MNKKLILVCVSLEDLNTYLLKAKNIDFWDTLSEEEQEDIKLGIKEMENGEKHPFEDIVAKYR